MIVYCLCGFKNEAIVKPKHCMDCGQSLEPKSVASFTPSAQRVAPRFDSGYSQQPQVSSPSQQHEAIAFDGEMGLQRDDGSFKIVKDARGQRINGKQPNSVRFTTLKEVREAGVEIGRGAPPDGTEKARGEIIPSLMKEIESTATQRAQNAPQPKRGGGRKRSAS